MIGETIAHYHITAKIGEGGMGEVYRATDTKLDRGVAIKILPAPFAADAERMARFEREAKVLASLNHPNIAAIYGVEDRALVMELVEGESPKGPIAFEQALNIAMQIADALEYAHEKGIVHRDLKPANIKVTPNGVVKLLDFGIAKWNRDTPVASDETQTMGLTRAGAVMGTPAYMAPEQWAGGLTDARSDIFAFGCILYELLTGRHVGLDRAPLKPTSLERVVCKCLASDPRERWQSAAEIKVRLKSRSGKSRWSYIIGAVVTLGIAAGSVIFWPRGPLKPHSPVTVLIADFNNNTADPVFGGTLESTLKLDWKAHLLLVRTTGVGCGTWACLGSRSR
jgi:serine/threonine-protein kinase